MDLKVTRFATMEYINSDETAVFLKISKEAFRLCFEQWKQR
jgi:hypothetical protein